MQVAREEEEYQVNPIPDDALTKVNGYCLQKQGLPGLLRLCSQSQRLLFQLLALYMRSDEEGGHVDMTS